MDKKGSVIYVGKAKNLKDRVGSYFAKYSDLGSKTRNLVLQIHKIEITEVNSEIESLLLEATLIKKYTPYFNVRFTDGKAYPLIRITEKNKYPAVLVSRRRDDVRSTYFGPFPNAGDMRLVLRTVRRIFPYISVVNHPKKYCLYWHLGLCPCTPVIGNKQAGKEYKRTVSHIVHFLSGDIGKVVKELKSEQKTAISGEEYEKAGKIQKQIDAMKLITQPRISADLYELNPSLVSDLRHKELDDLKSVLNEHELTVGHLNKIECYDISNIQGKSATGSLVVFANGEPDKTQYRRFKIRFTEHVPSTISKNNSSSSSKKMVLGRPNDFAMIQEVLTRRFKHTEWQFPDLMVIDGGKGQVSSAVSVLNKLGLNIPIIGLAKRLETIVLPNLHELRLPHRSFALTLLRRIRDEAHRFAITYHRRLRSVNAFV